MADVQHSFKRAGLHKCECFACADPLSGYVTFAQLETGRRPFCACGARMLPSRLECALEVLEPAELETHPTWVELERARHSVEKGQAPHYARSMQGRAVTLADPATVALERVRRDELERARVARASGLVQNRRRAAASAEIPF